MLESIARLLAQEDSRLVFIESALPAEVIMLLSRRTVIAGLGATGLLPGCATVSGTSRSLRTVSFESLVRQMKHDVGSYIFQHQDETPQLVRPPCGGQIDLVIQRVKMTVTATVDQTGGINAGLKVPINVITLEAGGGRSHTINNSVSVGLTLWPLDPGAGNPVSPRLEAPPPPSDEFVGTPICDALNQLRRDLRQTADTAPCFNFGDGDKQDNSVKWAFSVSDEDTVSGKLTILVFSIGGDSTVTHTFANTIEASFVGSGQAFR
jgi:hypothetical protein